MLKKTGKSGRTHLYLTCLHEHIDAIRALINAFIKFSNSPDYIVEYIDHKDIYSCNAFEDSLYRKGEVYEYLKKVRLASLISQ